MITRKLNELKNLLEIEVKEFENLPDNLKDDQKQKRLVMQILDLKIKQRNVVWQEVVNGELLFVYCGT